MVMIKVVDRRDLRNALPTAEASHKFEGDDFGDIPVSFFWTDAPAGTGPALHQHRYAEIFVVQEGNVEFEVGDENIAATAGQIIIAPAGIPHRFLNAGTGVSRHVDIHPVGRINGPTDGLSDLKVPMIIQWGDLPHNETSARFEGWQYGGVPVSFFWTDAPPNTGLVLHRHSYPEVFIIQNGCVRFTIGEESMEARAGQIVVAPAGQPHKFVNVGPGRAHHLDIHTSSRMVTEWLEEPTEAERRTFTAR